MRCRLWYKRNSTRNRLRDAGSRSHDAVIRVYDATGIVIETHEHAGESSMYTTLGSTLTITGERNVP